MMGGGSLDHLSEKLDLTADQKTRVQPIIDQTKPQIEAIHREAKEKMRVLMQKSRYSNPAAADRRSGRRNSTRSRRRMRRCAKRWRICTKRRKCNWGSLLEKRRRRSQGRRRFASRDG